MSIMQFMDRAAPLALAPAIALLGNEEQGLAFDFTAMQGFIRDRVTAANNWLGDPNAKLTYASPSAKWIWNAFGVLTSGTTLRCDHDPASLDSSVTLLNSLGIGAGAVVNKSVVLAGGTFPYAVGEVVRLTDASDISQWILGRVVSWTAGTKTLVIAGFAASAVYLSSVNWKVIVALGVRFESQRTNLLTRSGAMADATSWEYGGLTKVADAALAPDGTMTAVEIKDTVDGVATNHQVNLNYSAPVTAVEYTFSIFAKFKDGTPRSFRVGLPSIFASEPRAYFDLVTGVLLGTTGNPSNATIEKCANGWFRLSVSKVGTVASSRYFAVGPSALPFARDYIGDGTTAFYVWGAQLEVGSFLSSYIPTTSAQVTRAADAINLLDTNYPWSHTAGTAFVEFRTASPGPGAGSILYHGNANGRLLDIESTNRRIQMFDGTNGVASPNAIVAGAYYKAVGRYGPAGLRVIRSGSTATSNAAYVGSMSTSNTSLRIGSNNGTTVLDGHIRSVKWTPREASNAEMDAWAA